jgi:hypothetical protein
MSSYHASCSLTRTHQTTTQPGTAGELQHLPRFENLKRHRRILRGMFSRID